MKICERRGCTNEVTPDRWHPNQRYCGRACQEKANNEQQKVERAVARNSKVDIECAYEHCTNRFVPKPRQEYCSRKCAELNRSAKYKASRPTYQGVCAVEGCTTEWESRQSGRKYCDLHSRLRGAGPQDRADLPPDETAKLKEQAGIRKKIEEEVGRMYIIKEALAELVPAIDPNNILPASFKSKGRHDAETMVLVLGDDHIGAMTPAYDTEYYLESFDYYINRVVRIHEIMSDTIPLRDCKILEVGDALTGQGIYPNQPHYTDQDVIQQTVDTYVPTRIKLVRTLLDRFDKVESHHVRGNHGRTGKYNPNEVNFETLAAEMLKLYWRDSKRVNIEPMREPMRDWYKVVNIEGHGFLMTHGDTIRGWLGYPFYGVLRKTAAWSGSIGVDEPFEYIAIGHWHVPAILPWNTVMCFQNGTFVRKDQYALQTQGLTATPTQWVFGVHPKRGVTWAWPLNVEPPKRKLTVVK